jgi:prepilin-type N-terminal cleavage/methylation domain-containing protein
MLHKSDGQRFFESGFTFNEVLVAMTVVGVVVTGLFLGTLSLMRGNRNSDNVTTAINLAQHQLERLRSSGVLENDDRCPQRAERTTSAAGAVFDVCWSIAPSALGSRLKTIQVKVTWREQRPREITVSSLFFSRGDT